MKIAIIGAGVIGVSTGLQLAVRGHDVTIFDREGVASATSQGNAGAFAFTDVAPLATPGVMRKAPKWLLDPLGPLSIPPAYALNIAPWLLRFWRASWPDRYEAALAAQVSLMTQSRNALERLAKDHGMEAYLRREGQLQLYEGEAQFEASLPEWRERERHGVRFNLLKLPERLPKSSRASRPLHPCRFHARLVECHRPEMLGRGAGGPLPRRWRKDRDCHRAGRAPGRRRRLDRGRSH